MDQHTQFRYSKDELRVLAECNRESFYQRCLPIGTVFGLTTYLAVKSGKLSPNVRFGPIPKVFGAVVVGYLLGKISYQQVCAEKLMALPDSKLGAMLRNRNQGKNALSIDIPESDKVLSGMSETDKYDDVKKTSHMDIDTDRPSFSGLDDIYRPSLDGYQSTDGKDDGFSRPSSTTNYDELRRKNREEYEQNRTKPYRGVLNQDDIPSAVKGQDGLKNNQDPWFPVPQPKEKDPKNVYGDIWEK